MPTTVAQQLVATLADAGVQRVYGLPGDSLNGFTDALRRDGDVAWVHVRHEEAAAFAAAAEAALTGELAVCAASCGPGNLHLINGLFDANRSRRARAGDRRAHPERGDRQRATSRRRTRRSCSASAASTASWSSSAEQFPRVLEIAMRAAIEQRGVAVLVVPGRSSWKRTRRRRPSVRRSGARTASCALPTRRWTPRRRRSNGAARSTILAGAGCEGAHAEVVALAAALKAPVVHTLRGKEHVEYENPFDVGMTGLLGLSSGYRAMEHCDALLMLGTDFPYRQFYPEHATVIQVDIARRAHRAARGGRRAACGHGEGHGRGAAAAPAG